MKGEEREGEEIEMKGKGIAERRRETRNQGREPMKGEERGK